jgi:hypothetical protein
MDSAGGELRVFRSQARLSCGIYTAAFGVCLVAWLAKSPGSENGGKTECEIRYCERS